MMWILSKSIIIIICKLAHIHTLSDYHILAYCRVVSSNTPKNVGRVVHNPGRRWVHWYPTQRSPFGIFHHENQDIAKRGYLGDCTKRRGGYLGRVWPCLFFQTVGCCSVQITIPLPNHSDNTILVLTRVCCHCTWKQL
jgi:hypothetical protein